jgi:hypothetical protein
MRLKIECSFKALLIAGFAFVASGAQATDAEARALLKAMSDYVGGLGSLETSVDTSVEIITPDMEKIAFASSSTLKMTRPNQVHLQRSSAFGDLTMVFDGATLTMRSSNLAAYAQVPVKANTDELVSAVEQQFGMAVPGADLLLRNSYAVLVADVREAKIIGEGVIEGQRCDHLAFRNFDTDWQLWVRQGAEKIPCKMIITSKTVGMAPQYTVDVRSWKSNPKFPAGTFAFKPVAGDKRVEVRDLSAADEIPSTPSTGAPK